LLLDDRLRYVTEYGSNCCYGNVYWLKGCSLVTHGLVRNSE